MIESTTQKHSPICPRCASNNTHRSRRTGPLEWFLHYVLIRSPYRCQDCNERFFHHRLAHHPKEELHHPA